MNIYVTRHGQTDWNLNERIQGRTNTELNETGRLQAEETAQLIKDKKIDLIISSPLKRAKETAEIINKHVNVEIIEDERLQERCFGEGEGRTKTEVRALKDTNPELTQVWNYNINTDIFGIETMHDFCNRVYTFLDETIQKYNDKNILIVTHGGVSVPIQCYFEKIPLETLPDREKIHGLKNCEVAEYKI